MILALNDKGQCPACMRKPRPYKRENIYFCARCDRQYDMDTGQQMDNFAWTDGEERCD